MTKLPSVQIILAAIIVGVISCVVLIVLGDTTGAWVMGGLTAILGVLAWLCYIAFSHKFEQGEL
jgi:hypothetical protein